VHRLATGFVLAYHGCDLAVGERLLDGDAFLPSNNDYDWLGPGIYFWEAIPVRGLEFAQEASRLKRATIKTPFVIGAVIELGLCLDLLTEAGIELVRTAYESLASVATTAGLKLPENAAGGLRRNLDCAVIRRAHTLLPFPHAKIKPKSLKRLPDVPADGSFAPRSFEDRRRRRRSGRRH
jgi:hypothetical protein